jgi:hypothetical protein
VASEEVHGFGMVVVVVVALSQYIQSHTTLDVGMDVLHPLKMKQSA